MITSCFKCDLCANRKHIINGEGVVPSPIMFIGEAPGQKEDTANLPFVGKAGVYLSTILLSKFNLSRTKHYYITYVCKCKSEYNNEITWKQIESCLPYLGNEFKLVKPKIVCLLGATALKAFTTNPYIRINENRGKLFMVNDMSIIATYHPAAVLLNKELELDFINDIKQVAMLYRSINPFHQINI